MAKKNNKTNKDYEAEEMTVTLDLDDGTSVDCAVITIFTAMGKDYIALMPLDEAGENNNGEVWLYGYSENLSDPNEEPVLRCIESDEEYEIASDAFDEYLDTTEYDELVESEGLDDLDEE